MDSTVTRKQRVKDICWEWEEGGVKGWKGVNNINYQLKGKVSKEIWAYN